MNLGKDKGPTLFSAITANSVLSVVMIFLIFSFADAADKGITRAMSSGCKKPLMYLVESKLGSTFEASNLVSCLGALKALYVPLEMREGVPEKAIKLDTVGVYVGEDKNLPNVLKLATIIEDGKSVCRDIGGSDPERTAAPR